VLFGSSVVNNRAMADKAADIMITSMFQEKFFQSLPIIGVLVQQRLLTSATVKCATNVTTRLSLFDLEESFRDSCAILSSLN